MRSRPTQSSTALTSVESVQSWGKQCSSTLDAFFRYLRLLLLRPLCRRFHFECPADFWEFLVLPESTSTTSSFYHSPPYFGPHAHNIHPFFPSILSIHPPASNHPLIHLSIHPPIHPSTHSSINPPTYPPTHPSIHPFIHLPTHPCGCMDGWVNDGWLKGWMIGCMVAH